MQALELFSENPGAQAAVQKGDLETRVHSIPLFDPQAQRMRPYWVVVTVDAGNENRVIRQLVFTGLGILLASLMIIILGALWFENRLLIKPLRHFAQLIKGQETSEKLTPMQRRQGDELGILAREYNRLINRNQEQNRKLVAQANELETAINQANSANQAKSLFLANMSHEIRTPLNAVLGLLNLLSKDETSPEQRHRINLAIDSSHALLAIINNILDLSKIEARKISLEETDFNPVQLIGSIAKAEAAKAIDKPIDIIIDTSEVKPGEIRSDATRIRQICTNLINNAIKFTDQGEIEIRMALQDFEADKAQLVIEVRDTGIGIAQDKLTTIFDSFSQADASTTRNYGGSGLGLTITKLICEHLQGGIEVSSCAGEGTTFRAHVQVYRSVSDEPVKPAVDTHALHALVVTPNADLSRAISNQLSSWEIDTRCATNLADCNTATEHCPAEKRLMVLIDDRTICTDNPGEDFRYDYREDCSLILITALQGSACSVPSFKKRFRHTITRPVSAADLLECLQVTMSPADFCQATQLRERPAPPIHNAANILVVEDNSVNQLVIKAMLEGAGHKVTIANNGSEAIAILETGTPFDLVFMDCQMPVLDGYEATREIRQNREIVNGESIPIIAITANALAGDREKCLAAGMNDYLSKPIVQDRLQDILDSWLENSADQTREIADTDSPNADKDDTTVWNKTDALRRLSNREDLLQTLIQIFLEDAPRIVSDLKDSIIDNNYSQAKSRAHSIKGMAANLSLKALQESARNLEIACDNESEGEATSRAEHLQQCFEHATARISNYIAGSSQATL